MNAEELVNLAIQRQLRYLIVKILWYSSLTHMTPLLALLHRTLLRPTRGRLRALSSLRALLPSPPGAARMMSCSRHRAAGQARAAPARAPRWASSAGLLKEQKPSNRYHGQSTVRWEAAQRSSRHLRSCLCVDAFPSIHVHVVLHVARRTARHVRIGACMLKHVCPCQAYILLVCPRPHLRAPWVSTSSIMTGHSGP